MAYDIDAQALLALVFPEQAVAHLGAAEESTSCWVSIRNKVSDSCCFNFLQHSQHLQVWSRAKVSLHTGNRSIISNSDTAWDYLVNINFENATNGRKETHVFPISRICAVKSLKSADRQWAVGFELSMGRTSVALAVKMGSVNTSSASQLQLIHAKICLALEGSMRAVAPSVLVEWPAGVEVGQRAALAKLYATHDGANVVSVANIRQLASYAGSVCPICLEAWDAMLPNMKVISLHCGHAVCRICMEELAENDTPLACPTCRCSVFQDKDCDTASTGDLSLTSV